MDIDVALERAKPLGKTQAVVLTVSGVFAFEISWFVLSIVFIAEIPPHHCNVSLNTTLPVNEDNEYLECQEFVNPDWKNKTTDCSDGWYYDTEVSGRSIVSDWDLVCSKDSLPGISQSIMLAGFALGSVAAGAIADKYGRRPITIVSLVLYNIVGIAVSFSPSYVTFVILRLIMAILFRGVQLPPMVLMFEYLIPRYRPTFGNIPPVIFSLSLLLMTGVAYWIRDWRQFHAFMMIPSVLSMFFIWLEPESVRWLISQGKYEEAEKWMQKVAKFNGVQDFPNPALTVSNGKTEKQDLEVKNEKRGSAFIELFKPPTLAVTLIISWLWITYALVYFGFALTTGNLAGDLYLNFFLSSVVELPARIFPILILKRFGSLIPLISFLVASGVCMILIIVIPSNAGGGWLVTSLSLLGKFLIVCSFSAVNLSNSELFPTTVRSAGMGVCLLIGNLGSIASPILIYLDKFVPNLSLMTMTGSAFLAALFCLYLPETRNTVQPETPADLQKLFDSKRLWSRFRKTQHDDDVQGNNDSEEITKQYGNKTIEDGLEEYKGDEDDKGIQNNGFQEDTLL